MTRPQSPVPPETSSTPEHWEKVYRTRHATEVSWYRPHLERSLAIIEAIGADQNACVLDVGGGASTLVDDLLAKGYRQLSVLDLSEAALRAARDRLGASDNPVIWLHGDVRTIALEPQSIDVWHDRAVFHFLLEPAHRAAYVRQVARAMRPGGSVIVATFGPEGPTKCSGLDIVRYDAEGLHDEFGPAFRLVESRTELHRTPFGTTQQFVYCFCRVE